MLIDWLLVIVIAAVLILTLNVLRHQKSRGIELLEIWARRNGFRILSLEFIWHKSVFYTLMRILSLETGVKSGGVCFNISILDVSGREQKGWVICRPPFFASVNVDKIDERIVTNLSSEENSDLDSG